MRPQPGVGYDPLHGSRLAAKVSGMAQYCVLASQQRAAPNFEAYVPGALQSAVLLLSMITMVRPARVERGSAVTPSLAKDHHSHYDCGQDFLVVRALCDCGTANQRRELDDCESLPKEA